MKRRIAVAATAILFSVGNVKSQDTLVSAFFGLDNALPGLLCNQPGSLLDGMPVNFQFPLDASSLSETDFEVLDELGNVHAPICALLAPANENGENRTVLLLGEFGTAVSNPPVEVRIAGELFTAETFSGESACSEVINLNGMTTTNVVPLADGPSLFFAQKMEGDLNECDSGTQTIQVAWDGGVTPYISGGKAQLVKIVVVIDVRDGNRCMRNQNSRTVRIASVVLEQVRFDITADVGCDAPVPSNLNCLYS